MWKLKLVIILLGCLSLIPLGLLLLGAIMIEDRHRRLILGQCYSKHESNWKCAQKPCFTVCCSFQDEKWVEGKEKRAAKGDEDAKKALEFWCLYE